MSLAVEYARPTARAPDRRAATLLTMAVTFDRIIPILRIFSIEKAKELLRLKEMSVTDVCFEVGFESLGSFSALFRRCVGTAPVVYRKREMDARRKVPGCFIQMFGLGPAAR